MGRSHFGSIRKLPSARFQASYRGPDRQRHTAPNTFVNEREARRWLDTVEKDVRRGYWVPENYSQRTLREYCLAYLDENPRVGPRWAETCRRNMRLHLKSLLDMPVIAITPPVVRSWHAAALRGKGGRTSIAQTYRLLRSVLNVAVNDEAIPKNPCRIPGAGADRARERKIATPKQVQELVDAATPRYRAAILLAAWCGLRRGEICALRVFDLDLAAGTVTISKNWAELLESPVKYEKDPKSAAGKRTVTIPPHVLPALREHVEEWAGTDLLFIGRDGSRMNGNALYQAFVRARLKVDVEISFHDLRHTGQSLAAAAGANVSDLKERLGHSTTAAAMRYLHTVNGRDREIAQALSGMAQTGCPASLPTRG